MNYNNQSTTTPAGTPLCGPRFDELTPTDLVTLVDGATITYDTQRNAHPSAKVTLGGNRTLVMQNLVAGQSGRIFVTQDATGTRTLALPAGSLKETGFALSTAANAKDRLNWTFDGTNIWWTVNKAFA